MRSYKKRVQTVSRLSYVVRVPSGVYYFRRAIPPALRPLMPEPWRGKSVWKVSFRSADYARVKKAHPAVWAQCSADFETAERARRGERAPLSSVPWAVMPDLDEIEADELARLLAEDEAERSDGDARRQLQTAEERSKWPDLVPMDPHGRWMEDDHHHVYGLELARLIHEGGGSEVASVA
jgi:hypothetical protein